MTDHKQDSSSYNCMGNNPFFRKGKKDGFRFHCRNTPEMDVALEKLLPDPDAAFKTAQILKHGSRTHGGIIAFSNKNYYLKRYNDVGFWYRLRHMFKSSRAVRTWKVGWAFYNSHAPVPEPLICLEERRYLFLYRSYILMEHIEDNEKLKIIWPKLSANEKTRLVTMMAKKLARMHGNGNAHGDLKWSNILVSRNEGDLKLTLVDLDSCTCFNLLSKERARKDVKLFLRWLKHYESDREQLKFLIGSWEENYTHACN